MPMTRRHLLGLIATAPAVFATPALAREPEVFQSGGVAINGADPVAYFKRSAPVIGTGEHSFEWMNVQWYFANAANREAFMQDPETFAPRIGGYCAFAASRGYLAPTIPEAWTVYDGRLYLNANLRARELWLQDIPGNIAKGEGNWPAILG